MGDRPRTSRKRSGSRKRPEPPTFFLDECIDCDSIAQVLEDAGVPVERHRDHYEPGALDVDWIGPVSTSEWVILTADRRQRINQLELEAIVTAKARQFVIRGKDLSGQEMASRVGKHVKRMSNIAHSEPAPFVAHVTKERVKVMAKARALRKRLG